MFQFVCVGLEKPHGGRGGGWSIKIVCTYIYMWSVFYTGELLTLRVSLECFIASHGAGKSRKTERNGTSVY